LSNDVSFRYAPPRLIKIPLFIAFIFFFPTAGEAIEPVIERACNFAHQSLDDARAAMAQSPQVRPAVNNAAASLHSGSAARSCRTT